MSELPNCPMCQCENTYEDNNVYICPECGNEWSISETNETEEISAIVKDAHGSVLNEGDNVTIVKDLKVKGSSSVLKVGTKVKIIRFIDGDHNIDCKVDGIGAMKLKSEFVKKA